MNLRIPPWIFLGLLWFAFVPMQAAQHPAANPSAAAQHPASQARPMATPRNPQVERAKTLMAEKRFKEAIKAYEGLLKRDRKNAVYLNMVGIAYLNLNNSGKAKKYFKRAAKADKTYVSAVNNLGMVYYHQKNYRRAIKEYLKAEAIDPYQAGVHANLAFAYYNSKKYELASIEFLKTLEINPLAFEQNNRTGTMTQDRSVANHGLFFFTMARVYARKGDAVHCAEYLRKSLDEGYKDVSKAAADPAFKTVLNDPGVQSVLAQTIPAG